MSQGDKYFTFPIAFLQCGRPLSEITTADAKTRIDGIVAWCIIELTEKYRGDIDDPQLERKIDGIAQASPEYEIESDAPFLAAMVTLGIPTAHWETDSLKTMADFVEFSVVRDAGKKLARVRIDIFQLLRSNKISWREFAVLAAICAGCFDHKKRAASLKMEQIGAMALGYGSKKLCAAHGAEALLLSEKAIGRTVEKLRQRGWFVKASPDNGRNTYYSNKMSEEQMIEYVASIKRHKIQQRASKLTPRQIQQKVNAAAERIRVEFSADGQQPVEELQQCARD